MGQLDRLEGVVESQPASESVEGVFASIRAIGAKREAAEIKRREDLQAKERAQTEESKFAQELADQKSRLNAHLLGQGSLRLSHLAELARNRQAQVHPPRTHTHTHTARTPHAHLSACGPAARAEKPTETR